MELGLNMLITPLLKHWKFALLTSAMISLLITLGFWQLSRAHQKKDLLETYLKRIQTTPLTVNALNQLNNPLFFRVELNGYFDNAHTILLDNKTYHSQVGYEVYTPFLAHGITSPILVDRGFIPIGVSRESLPSIKNMGGEMTIIGLITKPPKYATFSTTEEALAWPMRVESIDLARLATKLLSKPLSPYILKIDPHDSLAYPIT